MDLAVARHIRSFLSDIPSRSHGLRIGLSLVAAYLTALSAQVVIPIQPVPITLQVFTVLLTSALLGPFYGGLSQVIYVVGGMAGLPWYACGGCTFGATAGYLAGFVAAGGLVGYMAHHHEFRGQFWRLTVAMTVGVVVIYIFGCLHLSAVMRTSYSQTLEMGVLPFIVPDMIKVAAAGAIVHGIFGPRWSPVNTNPRGM